MLSAVALAVTTCRQEEHMLLFSRQNKKVNNKLNSPLKSYLEEWLTLIALFLFVLTHRVWQHKSISKMPGTQLYFVV